MPARSWIGPDDASVRIGIAVALSGRYALLGRQVLAGLECFVEDVNTAGGLRITAGRGPHEVKLIVRDDCSDPSHCADAVRELIEVERVDILMGPYGSGLTLAAAKVAESFNMVLWNHSGSADQIFEQLCREAMNSERKDQLDIQEERDNG